MPDEDVTRFGDGFELDRTAYELRRSGRSLKLERIPMEVLLLLVERRGQLVSREEIITRIWGKDVFLDTDTSINSAIRKIRQTLKDDPENPAFIQTVTGKGYRFIATIASTRPLAAPSTPAASVPVQTVAPVMPPQEQPPQEQPPRSNGSIPGKGRSILLWAALAIAVVVAGGIALSSLHPGPQVEPISAPVPLTTYQGIETMPSFSPDGNQVAFQWDGEKQDNVDIYVKGLGPDAAPLRLTTNPAADEWPVWSPDGRTIAFERVAGPNRLDLMLIPALGGPERRLTELTIAGDSAGFAPSWSADSKWLIVPNLADQRMALFRVSVETSEMTQVTHPEGGLEDVHPAVSPDGKTLLFNRRAPFYVWGSAYAMRLDANALPVETPHRIPVGALEESVAAWMPDGKEIIARTPNGAVRLPVEGSDNPQPIPWLGTNVRGITLSLHSNRLAYALTSGDANIWSVDLKEKTPLLHRFIASTFRDVYPQFSPDGRRIAFHSTRTGDRSQVWMCNADGSQPRQMTFVKQGLAASPHWSPDGRTLEFDSNVTGTYQVYTMSSDGGKIRQMTDGHSTNYDGNYSRDGQSIYFASNRAGRSDIWKMPMAGGNAVQITHNGGIRAIESPDGKTLYFSKDTGEGSIWKMPLAGGPEEQLVDSLHRDNFALGPQGIYYMTASQEDGTSELKLYRFATGTSTIISPVGHPEYGLALSPDGRYLLYAQLDALASDLMLVENFH